MFRRSIVLAGICFVALLAGQSAWGRQPAEEDQTAAAPATSRWPMQISSGAGAITVFQPQLEDFQGDQLSARAAVSVTAPGQQNPIFGAIWLQSRVSTDRVARTVQILDVNVTKTVFPGADAATSATLSSAIKSAMVAQPITLSLDQLLAMLQTVQKENAAGADLDTTAPAIIFRDHPTVKVQYDGAPKLEQVPDSALMRVANTPFFVALDPASKTYFLKGGGRWFSASDPLGPFQDAQQVPSAVAALADASDYKDPQTPLTAAQLASLEIVTATDPTELIWTDGEPQMGTIAGTDLLYVTNTDSDMFLYIDTQQLFVLLSGRWYTAPNRSGPWTFVGPDKLPPDFSRIPPASDKGDVLAHVTGTTSAQDALADSQVPQTAAVDRQQFEQPTVQYDGDPQFQPVQGTPLTYCVNTATPVVFIRQHYYCCYNGCWYVGGAAVGPWGLCTAVPQEVYLIPPSCPIYPARFCYVYGYTPSVVYCGYLPGYVGCYTYGGVVVFGTGFHYHPWWGHTYYPRPCTWGFAAHYNAYVGHWGFSFGLATGSGSLWIGTGVSGSHSWGRSQPWFGYGGYRPVVVHNDVHVDIFRTQYTTNVLHKTVVRNTVRNDVYARNVYDRRTDVHVENVRNVREPISEKTTLEHLQNDHGGVAPKAQEQVRNNVYADKNGNVYRHTVDGWETQDKGKWTAAPKLEAPMAEGKGEGPKEEPRVEPKVEPKAEPKEEPKAEPRAEPAPEVNKDLNNDYRARVDGDARLKDYEKPAAPKAEEKPAAERASDRSSDKSSSSGHK